MKIPKAILGKIVGRFSALIEEADDILCSARLVPAEYVYHELLQRQTERQAAYRLIDWPRFVEWRTKAATVLSQVVPVDHIHQKALKQLSILPNQESDLEWGISILKGVKNDVEEGFLDGLAAQVEAEIASDYMSQAEQLLAEGQSGKFDHVPAAVLAGAVLEKGLRSLCAAQQPPVSTTNPKGEPKTLNPLIDDLKKAGVFNELRAK